LFFWKHSTLYDFITLLAHITLLFFFSNFERSIYIPFIFFLKLLGCFVGHGFSTIFFDLWFLFLRFWLIWRNLLILIIFQLFFIWLFWFGALQRFFFIVFWSVILLLNIRRYKLLLSSLSFIFGFWLLFFKIFLIIFLDFFCLDLFIFNVILLFDWVNSFFFDYFVSFIIILFLMLISFLNALIFRLRIFFWKLSVFNRVIICLLIINFLSFRFLLDILLIVCLFNFYIFVI